MTYILEWYCQLVSKKNKQVEKTKKDGKKYRTYGAATKLIREIERQIEPQFRDLQLVHPSVTISLTVPNDSIDRDGIATTIVDSLQKMGVIKNDNIKHFNGPILIHPAVVSDHWHALVVLVSASEQTHA